MKENYKSIALIRIAAVVAVFLAGAFCARADRIVESTWDVGLDGWVASGPAAVTNESGFVKIEFPAQTTPGFSDERITKDLPAGYRPNHISFEIRAPEVKPSVVRVYIASATGRAWYKNFEMPATNDWVRFNVIVSYASGWILGPMSTEAQFETDMDAAAKVSLHIVRNGTARVHEFNVDNFVVDGVLVGNPLPEDNDSDGMLDTWELAYGLDPGDPTDADVDSDNDGASNLHEYIAGTDPRSASSTLALEVTVDPDMPTWHVLSWPAAAGRTYQILKSTNLTQGFFLLEGGIEAQPPVNYYLIDIEAIEGATFFRLKLE
jgi:hypothetical protein